jgi:16S rRNA (cytosine1402-N4)-methyltransferase
MSGPVESRLIRLSSPDQVAGPSPSRPSRYPEECPVAEEIPPFTHAPVMRDEVTELFRPVPPGLVIDATLGAGGHARALLEARPDLRILGLDQDADARRAAARVLAPFGDRVRIEAARFDRLGAVVREIGNETVTGVLFDLGVSSPQLDRPDRGFSYRAPGPLDMRMDPTAPLTADHVVNTYDEVRLAEVLRVGSDERFAARISRAIVAARPLHTTAELAGVVRDAIPAAARRRGGHPAKRTFQAIRIEVNDELEVLSRALVEAIDLLAPGGRLAAIAYHSGEDRIVKDRLRRESTPAVVPPRGLPVEPERLGPPPRLRLLKRGAWTPSTAETAANPRAESARLRAAQRNEPTAATDPTLTDRPDADDGSSRKP